MAKKTRKVYTETEKLKILAEADASGDNTGVAKKYGVPRDYLYKWRRELAAAGRYTPPAGFKGKGGPAIPKDVGSLVRASQHRNMPPAAASDDEVERLLKAVGQLTMENLELRDQLKRRG